MISNAKVLVVVPAYNEEQYLAATLRKLREHRPTDDVLVVDDGSLDRTAAIARQEGARLLAMPLHVGYGAAVQAGLKYAFRRGYLRAVTCDADGQHEPACIGELLAVLDRPEVDLVIGSRFLKPGYRASAPKRLGVRFFGLLARLAIGRPVTDPTSGFIAYNRRATRFFITDSMPDRFPDADALIVAFRAGLNLCEAPVVMYPPPPGRRPMHSGLRAVYYLFNMLFSILVSVLRRDRLEPGEELARAVERAESNSRAG